VFVLGREKRPLPNCAACDAAGPGHDRETCDCLHCHGFYAATRDPGRVALMLDRQPGQLAVRTGPRPGGAGVIVLDLDAASESTEDPSGLAVLEQWEAWVGGDWRPGPTLTQRTDGGGFHLVYAHPPGPDVRGHIRVLPHVDVKSRGGYVAVEAGVSPRRWVDWDAPVAEPGPELLGWFHAARGRPGSRSAGGGTGAGAPGGYDFTRCLRDGPTEGERDFFWNDLLFRRRKAGVDQDEALAEARWLWEKTDRSWLWEDILYKSERDWRTVEPDVGADQFARWRGFAVNLVGTTGVPVSGTGEDRGPPSEPLGPTFANEPPEFHADLTDTGNAHRFVRLFHGRMLFVPGLGWHRWDGNVWVIDETDDAFEATQMILLQLREEQAAAAGDADREAALRAWYKTSSSMNSRGAALRGAAADSRVKILADSMNSDPYQLVVLNGTLDLRTQRIGPSRPDDHNTQVAAVTHDPAATCPRWLEHVRLITQRRDGSPDPALAAFLQRWAGYTLTGLVTEQKFFFGYGGGSNGKNVFIETLLGLMGTYAIRGSAQVLTGSGREHETILADLAGARMVFIDETPHGRINEARVKALTGSSRLRARKMRQDTFEYDARFKLWIAGNNKPRVGDTTRGFWRRLDLVPFDTTIEHVIPGYVDTLRDEWPGVLNWALVGLDDYLRSGGLQEPERVVVAGQEYRDEENAFGQFVEECFDREREDVWTPNNALHATYRDWSAAAGVRVVPAMQQLANDWRQAGFERDDTTHRIRQGWPRRSAVQRGWVGPRLRAVEVPFQWDGMYEVPKDDLFTEREV
jgi:putative DNA primase/helicase